MTEDRAGNVSRSMDSTSTSVRSLSQGNWWTQEEARLYNKWGATYQKYAEESPNPYFDYFYSGTDVKIKVDGLDDSDFLPIYSFGYQIQQEKVPLYGYASYTYDAMMRGVRIISGAFSLVVTEPHLLASKIGESAMRRAATSQRQINDIYALRQYDGDVEQIDKYWGKNFDSNITQTDQHLFSIHPPFNFLIKYGIQETSLTADNPNARVNEVKKRFSNNTPLWQDVNERLSNPSDERGLDHRILLENIELTSKSIQYDSSGDPLIETYSFLARDERLVDTRDRMEVNTKVPRSSNVPNSVNTPFFT
jgi:hypothetical protein